MDIRAYISTGMEWNEGKNKLNLISALTYKEIDMTNNEWYQMWVRAPEGADPLKLIEHCEPFLDRMTCIVETSLRTASRIRKDGTIGVRGFNESGFRYAKKYLEEQGFVIEDERVNE